jgi:hypothetical protein
LKENILIVDKCSVYWIKSSDLDDGYWILDFEFWILDKINPVSSSAAV